MKTTITILTISLLAQLNGCASGIAIKGKSINEIENNCLKYSGNDTNGYLFVNSCAHFQFYHNRDAFLLERDWNKNRRIFAMKIGLRPVLSKFNDSIGNNISVEVFNIDSVSPVNLILNSGNDKKLNGEIRKPNNPAAYFSTGFTSEWDNPREPFQGIFTIFYGKKFTYRLNYIATESTFNKNLKLFEEIESKFKILEE